MKKNKGFTLIELVVVLGIIGILSSLITPKFMGYLAKGKDVKAVATLESLRTASEFYYLENGKSFVAGEKHGTITKEQFDRLRKYLSNNSKKLIDDNKDISIEIGGSRTEKDGPASYGGRITFTTRHPSIGKSSNGIDIWFEHKDDSSIGKYNLNNERWVDL